MFIMVETKDFQLSTHAKEMLAERNIQEEWMWCTLLSPENTEQGIDRNKHYTRAIEEADGKVLHIVVNDQLIPNVIVTLFFDRRISRKAR